MHSYAQQSLKTLDLSYVRTVAMTIVDLGEAYVQCTGIDEAARLLGDAGDIAARNSSARPQSASPSCAHGARSCGMSPTRHRLNDSLGVPAMLRLRDLSGVELS
jgi:hypothetical protein